MSRRVSWASPKAQRCFLLHHRIMLIATPRKVKEALATSCSDLFLKETLLVKVMGPIPQRDDWCTSAHRVWYRGRPWLFHNNYTLSFIMDATTDPRQETCTNTTKSTWSRRGSVVNVSWGQFFFPRRPHEYSWQQDLLLFNGNIHTTQNVGALRCFLWGAATAPNLSTW